MTEIPVAGARTSLVRLLLLGGALAGLFAMHGLGDHGTAHSGAEPAHAMVAMSTGPAGHMSEDNSAAAATRGDARVGTMVSVPGGVASGAMALCMAVLAGVLFALAGPHAWGRRPAIVGTRLPVGITISATARERDPPCLAQLSICRC